MIAFLKRWYSEFEKDREIRENELLPTMSIEEFCKGSREDESFSFLSLFSDEGNYSPKKSCARDSCGNPDIHGENYW